MAGPRDVVVRFLADTRAFLTGTEQVEDAYDAMARDADKAADAGEDSARRLARAYDRAGDEIRRDMDKTGRDLKADVADTGKEAGQEFATNLGSSLASGDSSKIVQDSAGGLIGALALAGPIGIAVAAGASIALALWNSFEAKTQAQLEAIKQVAGDVYQGLLDDAATFAETYGSTITRAFFDPASEDEMLKRARTAGARLKIDIGGALAGGPTSVAALADKAREALNKVREAREAGVSPTAGKKLAEDAQAYSDIVDYLDSIVTGWGQAEQAVKDYNLATKRAATYSAKGSSYAVGGSTYQGQVPRQARTQKYAGGKRDGT